MKTKKLSQKKFYNELLRFIYALIKDEKDMLMKGLRRNDAAIKYRSWYQKTKLKRRRFYVS